MYKYEELEQHYKDRLIENGEEWVDAHKDDIHHYIFNEDYYIIGTYQAKEWLGDNVFECIEVIREYEQSNFGEVNTDFSDPEKVVNMYSYIVGEQVVNNVDIDDVFAEQHSQ
jgi:hypothetical protein|tara:strand:+ start:48 stop:383 length:336 start_codon:yes stop_codon:yes gene_type:complete